MINVFQAIILGIVEGLTEFLPVSSTGHLILASTLLKISQTEFVKSFEIAIQLGAMGAVVALYFRSLKEISTLKKIAVGFIPTGLIGLALYPVIRNYLIGSQTVVLWALLLGGIALIVFEKIRGAAAAKAAAADNAPKTVVSYRDALLIGLAQAAAIIPGISRSAATIVGGLLLGIDRKTIVEFSFLLAVPTILTATIFDLYKNSGTFTAEEFGILGIGFIVSFFVAMGSIKFLISFIKTRTFISFGVYRIIIALIFFLAVV